MFYGLLLLQILFERCSKTQNHVTLNVPIVFMGNVFRNMEYFSGKQVQFWVFSDPLISVEVNLQSNT